MRGMPFPLSVKGALDVSEISNSIPSAKWKNCTLEPTSVLDTRSPSPPASASTLSSSFGGSTDTGVAAVSENTAHRWPASQEDVPGRKEEWVSDLQPIPSALEIANEKCGLGMEDWEHMLSSSAFSPANEQSIFKWFMGDVEDPCGGLKQLMQSNGGMGDLDGCAPPSTGFMDPVYGVETGSVVDPVMDVNAGLTPATLSTAPDFASNGGSRLVPNQNPLPNFRSPLVAANGHITPNSIFPPSANTTIDLALPLPLSSGLLRYPQQQFDAMSEKPRVLSMNYQLTHPTQNPSFILPAAYMPQHQQFLHRQFARPNPAVLDANMPMEQESLIGRQHQQESMCVPHLVVPPHLQQRPGKPKMGDDAVLSHQHQQAIVDQLFKAAEMVEAGNSINARGILARLNHQLPSPVGKPVLRAAFYFKEALQMLVDSTVTSVSASPPSPVDVVFKISAYKVFSEISPFLQFANFTSNQALLEALDGYSKIHILDFDIGFGGQWASFMQELALKLGGAPFLKVTAFVSPSSADPLELALTRDNLSYFASEHNISFEFNFVNLETFDLSLAVLNLSDNEAVAVNLPVSPVNPSLPSLVRFAKQLNPRILVSIDDGPDRGVLSFPHHLLHCLQSCTVLLDSLDAFNVNPEAVQKIERYLLKPRINNTILARHQAGENILPWRTLFASAGFSPIPFSNFTETQAECLVKRLHVREFHVEKRQASLFLHWRRGELVSVTAWRC